MSCKALVLNHNKEFFVFVVFLVLANKVNQTCQPQRAKTLEVDCKESEDSVKNREILWIASFRSCSSKTTFRDKLKVFKRCLIKKAVLELAVVWSSETIKKFTGQPILVKRSGGGKTKNKNSTEKYNNLNCDQSRADSVYNARH